MNCVLWSLESMVIGSKRYFPYPILWLDEKTDYKKGNFHCAIQPRGHVNGNNLKIEYNFILENLELIERIKNKEIVYSIHVECPNTGYRNIVTSSKSNGSTLIEESLINGELQVCTFLIAAQDINDFENSDFVEELQGFTFNIEKGLILGIAESYTYHVDTTKTDLSDLPSVVYFVKNEDPEARAIITAYESDRIAIKLPSDTFVLYKKLSQVPQLHQNILHAMFIVPSLVTVISEVQRSPAEDREDEFGIKRWYRAINKSLAQHNKPLMNTDEFDRYDAYEVIQEILNNPQYNALPHIETMVFSQFEEEEE